MQIMEVVSLKGFLPSFHIAKLGGRKVFKLDSFGHTSLSVLLFIKFFSLFL
jgi:hypothetical protein